MTTQEASKILKMLLGYLKGEIEPPNPKTIEEAVKFEQEGYECLNIAIRNLEAWEKVKDEIQRKANSGQWSEATVYGMNKSISIIDKHLKEVEHPCEYMQYGECTYSETGCGDCKAKLKALGYMKEVENG